jgi:hypothetical protein
MSHRLSQNARNTNELLEELERDKELEVLREYLTRFDLFPRKRDPASAPIRFEELKELVKHWKLHRQRNFWKNHTTKEDLVRTLYRHINTKIIPQEARDESSNNAAAAATSPLQPTPPPGNVSGAVMLAMAPMAPMAPARKTSLAGSIGESPRSKSILVTSRSPVMRGPRRENVMTGYSGDLFSQRGDYEDGMIYLSRFRKPGTIDMTNPFDVASDAGNQESKAELDDDDASEKSHESLALPDGLTREVRLKQECAFSIYHVRTCQLESAVYHLLNTLTLMCGGVHPVHDVDRERAAHGGRGLHAGHRSAVDLRRHGCEEVLRCRHPQLDVRDGTMRAHDR